MLGRNVILSCATIAMAAPTLAQPTGDWDVDPNHTNIGFTVRHFFTPVRGHFEDFDIEIHYDEANPTASSISVDILVESVDTGNERRDNHLRTADFFHAEQFPHITFVSHDVRRAAGDTLIARGMLTIKDVSQEVELPITVLGIRETPEEQRRRFGLRLGSFQAAMKIDRRDFGVGTGSWAETAVVGADVEIEILLEASQR